MKKPRQACWMLLCLSAMLPLPAIATVKILSLTPSLTSPQKIGKSITWTATATDSNAGRLTFQFSVAAPGQSQSLVRDFNAGTHTAGTWSAPPFVWVPTGIEGSYQVQVVVKDFTSGESATKTATFQIDPLVTGGTPVVVKTANPLVALFSAPSCAAGSTMRISFQKSGASSSMTTNWVNCNPPNTMTFEIAGMHYSSTYSMYSQTKTGGNIVNGPTVTFKTGALPSNISFPAFTPIVSPGSKTDTTDSLILHNCIQLTGSVHYPDVATDLHGNIMWYYDPNDSTHISILTRPLPGGAFLAIEDGVAWNPAARFSQYLHQIDLAGNIVRETNTGIIQQQLLALGATDGGPCSAIASPPPVGSACLGAFHHDAIQTLPNGQMALIADIEKIFPPGTQGKSGSLPVDIVGDMFVVLDSNWQAVWYWDSFEHAGGGTQLDISRPAVLGEICSGSIANHSGCPPLLLLGPGVSSTANDWLHANSLYYWPQTGDIIWSSRHQDWIMKIDYNNGSGTGNILWRMGNQGDFTFNNVNNDPWPWFSHQHEVGMENNGAGPLTVFDNGNTRLSPPPLGLGNPGCRPSDCNSRGMSLTVDEANLQVTPVLSQDLGVFSPAMGSAQLLFDNNYFFLPADVFNGLISINSYSIEILPTPGTINGTQVLNLEGPEHYRAWQMPNLYTPPTT
jgi:hypothetical protein